MKQYLSVFYHYAPRILLLVLVALVARVSYGEYVSYQRSHAKGPMVVWVDNNEQPQNVAHAAKCLSSQKIPYQFDGAGNMKIQKGNTGVAASACSS